MKRLLLVIASAALALGATTVAATSLSFNPVAAPAQGTITVSGACISSGSLSYTYVAGDGTTATTPDTGDAAYVKSIVVTRVAGPSSCVGTNGAIRFSNTDGSTSPALETGAENPTFSGDATSGTWTFLLDTTTGIDTPGSAASRNAIGSFSTGDTITVTVY